jgi:hypothetical protein
MQILELRKFVLKTRQKEGVNWYLTDMTPSLEFQCKLFNLYCYDDAGRMIHSVMHIEERIGGKIPQSKLNEIYAARILCGVNQFYLRRKGRATREERVEKFRQLQAKWPSVNW